MRFDGVRRGRANGLLIAAIVVSCACSRVQSPTGHPGAARRGTTSFYDEGRDWFIGVDARAAILRGKAEFLPLQVVLVDKKAGSAAVTRESFLLETPEGVQLPVVSWGEFRRDYRRDRADLRIGQEFVENLTTRFAAPPYSWRELEFFPPRNSATPPRDMLDLRRGDLAFGYLYFRVPSVAGSWSGGTYKLLVRPFPGDATYVVDVSLF